MSLVYKKSAFLTNKFKPDKIPELLMAASERKNHIVTPERVYAKRRQVLDIYYGAVNGLMSEAKTSPDAEPGLQDTALWLKHTALPLEQALRGGAPYPPGAAGPILRENLVNQQIPEGFGIITTMRNYPRLDGEGDLPFYVGLEVDSPIRYLRRRLDRASSGRDQKGFGIRIDVLTRHSAPSDLSGGDEQLATIRAGIFDELGLLGSPSRTAERIVNAERLATARMLMLPQ